MQRAAASSSIASTPQGSPLPSSKRQKTTHSSASTPATPHSDQAAIQAATEAEEAQRETALTKIAAERGETKWVLSFVDADKGQGGLRGLRIVKAGYSDIDNNEGQVGGKEKVYRPHIEMGRRSFGNFNRELEVCHKSKNQALRYSSGVRFLVLLKQLTSCYTYRDNRIIFPTNPLRPAMKHPITKNKRLISTSKINLGRVILSINRTQKISIVQNQIARPSGKLQKQKRFRWPQGARVRR